MARRVFFSFHYERDIWRVNQVRNSWVTKPNIEEAGYIDKADFEKLKKRGNLAIKRWINNQLIGTSVTVVLIGAETYIRRWVRYEILKSFEKGNGLLGIYIHKLKDEDKNQDRKGPNPFDYLGYVITNNNKIYLYEWKLNKWTLYHDISYTSLSNVNYTFHKSRGRFSDIFSTYDWIDDNGYDNIGYWIEKAAKKAGR